ncbi:MAG TPA: DUF4126 domain-containing protein [Clostridia bacterium]|nr:DUF4126 domain-containing protein [Clostridia bacterium]
MKIAGNELVAMLVATSFAAGLNVYATVATLGLLSRFDVFNLPPALQIVQDWWVIGACAALFLLEFVADKIPVVDMVWNALQTFVRVPVAALLAYGATASLSPQTQLASTILGGVVAMAAHTGKTAVRAGVTPSPEPFSNMALSTAEDAGAIGLTWVATSHPYIAAGVVVVLLIGLILIVRWIIRALRSMFRRLRQRFSPSPDTSSAWNRAA